VSRLIVVVALLGGLAFPCAGGASGWGSGIKGVVVDTTCAGPCRYPPPPPSPYTGDGLTVKVRRLPTHHLVATRHPTDGRFRVAAAPGRYRVSARVGQPGERSCWSGEAKRVRVRDGRFRRVRLHVYNACVV
jgi:hypothetical protein